MKPHPVTIVVLSKYREVLQGFVDSWTKHLSNYPVVCIADTSDAWAPAGNWVTLRGPEKFSMAGNGNMGLKAVPADHDILYVGDDVRFLNSDTIEQLQRVAYFNNQIGLISPKLLGRASPALAMPDEKQSFSYVRPLEFWYPCVYIKREVIDKVGFLDDSFNEFGSDDLDYNIRVQKAGYKLAVTPRVVVHHESSPEGGPTTFIRNIGVDQWQRQQENSYHKLQKKLGVDEMTFRLFLETNDMKLLEMGGIPKAATAKRPEYQTQSGIQQKSLADKDVDGQGHRGLAGKSLFVMVPMYGGQCTMNFFTSFLLLIEACRKFGVNMSYMVLHNESLVTRARNRMIDYFDKKSDATHCIFIDADIGFDANDILVMLDLDMDVAGLACVKKAIRWDRVQDLVKNNGRKYTNEELAKVSGDFILNFAKFEGKKTFNLGEPQEAHSVGTGVMMVARRVVDGLKKHYPDNWYIGSRSDPSALEGPIFDHFKVGIDAESRDYYSEDYTFCVNVRKAGFRVWVIPWAQTSHAGTHLYVGDMPTMSSLMPSWAR